MPRVHHVKKARKDNPAVKAGEPYYWWKFRYGGKRYSKTYPKRSQLTQSAYFASLYDLQDTVEGYEPEDPDDLEALKDEVRSAIEDIRDETQEKLDNMSEYGLEYSPTGEMLQERIDALEQVDSELDMVDEFDFEEEEFTEPEPDRADYASGEDGDVEFNDAHTDWADMKAEHEESEKERRDDEFSSWVDEAKSTINQAIEACIV